MEQQFVFNGKRYRSLSEMPEKDREAFEKLSSRFADKNMNGVPDCFEKLSTEVETSVISVETIDGATRFTVNGEVYGSPEEMPPEVANLYRSALSTLDRDRDGVPDVIQQLPRTTDRSAFVKAPAGSRSSADSEESTDHHGRVLLKLLITVMVLAPLALGAVYLWEEMR